MVEKRSSAQSPVDASPLRFLGTVWRGLSLPAIDARTSPSLHTRPSSTCARPRIRQRSASSPCVRAGHPSRRRNHSRRGAHSRRATCPCRSRLSRDRPWPRHPRGRAPRLQSAIHASEPPKVSDSTPGAVGGSGKREARQEDRTLEVLRRHVCWTPPPGRRRSRPASLEAAEAAASQATLATKVPHFGWLHGRGPRSAVYPNRPIEETDGIPFQSTAYPPNVRGVVLPP